MQVGAHAGQSRIVVALFFFDALFELSIEPYHARPEVLGEDVDPGRDQRRRRAAAAAAQARAASPRSWSPARYWLYQIWALHRARACTRRRSAGPRIFAAIAGPLFLTGVVVGYYVLPKGIEVLIGFTPADLTNLVEFGEYFSFFTRMMLVFGIAFEIPLFVVMLNLAGDRVRA